ncbi:recombinase family protein [Rheinheimera sp.]|uniref:recombinase family protein n=1 Tax=Rheinheimera sp. TaxID=1869214 RepID=UPI004048C479
MKIGYCRISTKGQSFHLQEDVLKAEGCERVFRDIASGAKSSRPGLDEMLAQLRPGDVIVVYKLDRLGRSLRHLVDLINTLSELF